MNELIGNLKTYELKRKHNYEINDPKKEWSIVMKVIKDDSSEVEQNMAYLTQRFQKMVINGGFQNRKNLNRGFREKEFYFK